MSYSLSFSKSILVVIFVADKMRQGQYEFLSTASISKILNIPKPTLVQILQGLSMAGIIQTREGKFGGVRLQKEPENISILDILQAVEKGKSLFNTSFDLHVIGKRPDNAQKQILSIFSKAEQALYAELASRSVAQLLEEMSR